MKRKNLSLGFSFGQRARSVLVPGSNLPVIVTSTPGDISDLNPRIGFSCTWTWKRRISEADRYGAIFLGADDGATLTIDGESFTVPKDGNYGTQGGSPYTSISESIELSAGIYKVTLSYFNINYNPPSANVARLDFSLPGEDCDDIAPEENNPPPEENLCKCPDENLGGSEPETARSRARSLVGSSSAGRNTRLVANETYAHWQTDFGKFRGLGGLPAGTLEILAYAFDESVSTPAKLEFAHPLNAWLVLPEGGIVADSQVKVCTGGSYTSWYCEGSGETFFSIGTSSKTTSTLAWTADKTGLVLTQADKSAITFSVTDGEIVAYKTKNGNVLSKAEIDTYVDIVRDGNGVLQQVWNLWDGLANVENVSASGYEIALYLPGQVGAKDAESGLYAVTGTPFKRFTIALSGEETSQKLTITEQDSRPGAPAFARSVWFENGIWNSSVGSGAEEIITRRTRTAIDDTHFRVITETLRSGESVPATCVGEVFEIDPALGNLCVSRTEGYGTDYAETTTFGYDDSGRLVRETRPDGGVFETTFDRYGRVSVRYEPHALGRKITYFYYQSETNNNADLKYSRVALEKSDGTPVLYSRTDYVYVDETEFRCVERRTTALGLDNTQVEVEETFLGTCENVHARGRVKMRQVRSGVQTHYDYAATSLHGALYTQTAETRIAGEAVAGKSSREVKFISLDGNTLRTEKYLLDSAGTWRLVASSDFEYDSQNRETKRTRGNGRVSSREMMCCGTLWEIDEDGVRTDYVYDTAQQLTEKTRALTATQPERTQLFTRDAAGRVTREVLKLNSVDFSEKSADYDAFGRTVSETDELGRTTTYAYALDATAKTRTETVTLPSGATRITKTHADGTVLSEAGTSRRAVETVVDTVSDGIRTTRRLAGTTDESGVLSREIKNGFGETVRTETPNTLGGFIYTRNTFDALGRRTRSATDTLAPTLYDYDAFGNETKRTLALADEPTALNSRITETSTQIENRTDGVYRLVSTTTYNATGTALVTSVATLVSESATLESKTVSTDARGNATTRWTEFGEPGIRISKTQIPTATNVAQTTTNDGFTVSQLDHAGTQTGFARQYNTGANAGIVLTTTDGRGNATIVEQNVLGWTTKTTDAAGNVTTTVYDLGQGKPACVTDALGKTHCYAYDLHGNVVAEFGSGAQPVVFSFDDADNPVSQKLFRVPGETLEADPRSRTDLTADETRWIYHATTGLLLSKIYPDEGQIDYAYDALNRLVSTTWTREVSAGTRLKATRTYAEMTGELVSVSYNDDATPSETHAYNHLGQLTQTVDAAGTTTFTYDDYGAKLSETVSGVNKTITRHYDSFGRDAGYSVGGTRKTTLSYDAASGRLVGLATGNDSFAWEYLAGTQLKSKLTYPNAATAEWTYEAKRDLLTCVKNTVNGNVISQYDYANDALGRRVSVAKSGTMTAASETLSFGYNNRSELTSAVSDVDTNYNYAYAFDNIGNRTSATETAMVSTYTTNALNQYDSISMGEATFRSLSGELGMEQNAENTEVSSSDNFASFAFTPTYDLDGNATLIQTSTGTWAIEYNGANRPIRWTNAATGTVITMTFDSQGRRVEYKSVTNGTQNTWLRFLYDGYLCIQVLYSNSPYNVFKEFIWDPTEPVATRPLVFKYAPLGTTMFYAFDGNKNVSDVFFRALSNGIGAHYEYAPFGATTRTSKDTVFTADFVLLNPYRFSSEVYDSELDLVYYNYRHYSPSDGRFLSRDPIEEQGGLNLYAFVGNNPLMRIDVIGKDFCSFLENVKSEALEKLDEKIQRLREKLHGKIEKEIKRNIDREYRKFAEKYGSPLGNYSSLTLFPTIDSASPISGGISISFSAYLTSSSLVNVNGRDYALKGNVEYTIDYDRENLDSNLKITDDVGMCGVGIDIDYRLNKNWSFRLSLKHECSYEDGFSESGNGSVNFNFKYIK